MTLYDWLINVTTGLLGKNISQGDSILEVIMNSIFGKAFDLLGRNAAEKYAYNWYLLL